MGLLPLADLVNLGWLRIGPPIYLNINPVIFSIGPLAVRWYGLMYVVGIIIGLLAIRGYMARKGISEDLLYRLLWWCIAAGLIGGRLYFVVQQPDLVQDYILQPWRILATWEGGMAFFGAIFLIIATLFWRARAERVNPLVLIDAAVLFGAVGQIFGRFGNIVNGDIVGYPSNLPWATVYVNPNSWACLPGSPICNVPVQPAAVYEIFCNLVMLGVLLYLARRVQRPGILALVYLFGYTITQFLVFFVRSNVVVNFLGTFILKQAQWTSVVVFILLIPISYLVMRWHYAQPVPANETAITYGIPQKASTSGQPETKTVGEDIANVDDEQHITHVADPAEAVAGAEAKDVSSSTGDEQSDEQAAHTVNPAETTPKEEPTDEVSARANTSDKPEL